MNQILRTQKGYEVHFDIMTLMQKHVGPSDVGITVGDAVARATKQLLIEKVPGFDNKLNAYAVKVVNNQIVVSAWKLDSSPVKDVVQLEQ